MSKKKTLNGKNLLPAILFYIGIIGYLCFAIFNFGSSSGGLFGDSFAHTFYYAKLSFWYTLYSFVCISFCSPASEKENKESPTRLHTDMAKLQSGLAIILAIAAFT
jgi:magnesium-transporting ATPase (P-type)